MDTKNALCQKFAGPLLFDYVWWVLQEAQKAKLTTLYFLARDGFLLQKIAIQLCEQFQLKIDCRYLYCSRAALRMPTYWFLGEEAFDLLLLSGYRISLFSVLNRLGLTQAEIESVCVACDLDMTQGNRILSRNEFEQLKGTLRNCPVYRAKAIEKSKRAYPAAVDYLRQEGLFRQRTVAIVDSGWTGSMQRSLRQLLAQAGYCGTITGFYFGMYAEPKEKVDGIYRTWLFDRQGKMRVKIDFSNNLFECLLSAPHGMTVGYEHKEQSVPVLLHRPIGNMSKLVDYQIASILAYTKQQTEKIIFEQFDEKQAKHRAKAMIHRYMAHPTAEEATVYATFLFCDDITEGYQQALTGKEQISALCGYSIPARIAQRFFRGNGFPENRGELFWSYGSIAFLSPIKRAWYRWNVYIWEFIRYAKQR